MILPPSWHPGAFPLPALTPVAQGTPSSWEPWLINYLYNSHCLLICWTGHIWTRMKPTFWNLYVWPMDVTSTQVKNWHQQPLLITLLFCDSTLRLSSHSDNHILINYSPVMYCMLESVLWVTEVQKQQNSLQLHQVCLLVDKTVLNQVITPMSMQ